MTLAVSDEVALENVADLTVAWILLTRAMLKACDPGYVRDLFADTLEYCESEPADLSAAIATIARHNGWAPFLHGDSVALARERIFPDGPGHSQRR